MPTIPTNYEITDKSNAALMNAVRSASSPTYQSMVPEVTAARSSWQKVGSMIIDNPLLRNEFYNNLANQIAFVFGTSKAFRSRYRKFQKGVIDLGEMVEEFFVEIAKPHRFNPEIAETEVFKRVISDVHAAIYEINVKTFYKATISREQIAGAFTKSQGVYDLIGQIFQSMVNGKEVDDMNLIKYLIGRLCLDGKIKIVIVPDTSDGDQSKSYAVAKIMKEHFNNMTFPRADYNRAGVINWTNKDDVTFLLTTKFDATYSIDVLSASFQLTYTNFMGMVEMIDSLSNVDFDRLNQMLVEAGAAEVDKYTTEEKQALDKIVALNFDNAFMQIYARLFEFEDVRNGEGLYWNNFLHYWALYASSPFAPAVAYATEGGSVTSVTVSPTAVTLPVGASMYLDTTVKGTGFFSKEVMFVSDSPEEVTVDANGLVTNVSKTSGTANINIASKQDSSKTTRCVVTGANVTG